VTLTALLKGYCEAGDVRGAKALLEAETSRDETLVPNQRTVNTLLRGCVRIGCVETATDTFASLDRWGVDFEPDESAVTAMCGLLCRSLEVDSALNLIKAYGGGLEEKSKVLPTAHLMVATAAALVNDWAVCGAELEAADAALVESNEERSVAVMRERFESAKAMDNAKAASKEKDDAAASSAKEKGKGGGKPLAGEKGSKKGSGRVAAVVDDDGFGNARKAKDTHGASARHSVGLFNTHKDDELAKGIASLRAHLDRASMGGNGNGARGSSYASTLMRVLPLEEPSSAPLLPAQNVDETSSSSSSIPKAIALRLLRDFGLARASKKNKNKPVVSSESVVAQAVAHLEGCFDEVGFVDFHKVAQLSAEDPTLVSGQLPFTPPVKMELCSGGGEWSAAQAHADPDSLWVAVELRHDRVCETVARMHLEGIPNLCVVGPVDASHVLSTHVAPSSIDTLFVNHPEPPERTGEGPNQGEHLLVDSFFALMRRALKPSGTVTIVTDSLPYALALAASVSKQRDFTSAHLIRGRSHDQEVHEEVKGFVCTVVVYVGQPGSECGHNQRASSFFDRMWTKGQKKKRYTLFLAATPHDGDE